MIDPTSQPDALIARADAMEALYQPGEFHAPTMASTLAAADSLHSSIVAAFPPKPATKRDESLSPEPLPFAGHGIESLLQSAEGSADAMNDIFTRIGNLLAFQQDMLIDHQNRLEQLERRLERQRF